MRQPFNFETFQALLYEAARAAFQEIRRAHAGETFYVFALFTYGELGYLSATASTEQGLTRVAQKYIAGGWNQGKTLEEMREALRWNPVDSPLHLEGQEYFAAVNDFIRDVPGILYNIPTDDSWDEFHAFFEHFIGVCIQVLQRLDAESMFGTAEARDRIVLNVLMGDQSDEERLGYAQRLNPEAVFERFRTDYHA